MSTSVLRVVVVDLNGNQKWERRLPLPDNPYGAVSSPIVVGDLLVLNHQGKDSYLLAVNRRDGRTVWKTDRSLFQYGWSTPVHWRHDGIDEIVVLGGDFKPNQRLMAYALADGSERWWVGGLPPSGKSTPVIGDGLLFFAAPDIIMEPAAERRKPDRAAQFYANNSARVVAVRPGATAEVGQANIAWSERKGVPGVPSPLYYNGRLYTFQNGGIVFCRVAKTGEFFYSGRLGAPGYYYSSPVAADNKVYIASEDGVVVYWTLGPSSRCWRRTDLTAPSWPHRPWLTAHLCENRNSPLRFRQVNRGSAWSAIPESQPQTRHPHADPDLGHFARMGIPGLISTGRCGRIDCTLRPSPTH